MKTFVFLTSLMLSMSTLAANAGLTEGHDYTATTYQGKVTVVYVGGSSVHFCQKSVLSPENKSTFFTDTGVRADLVTLYATHQDGSTIEMKKRFDSDEGESRKSFRLWRSSYYRAPLLEMGVNSISYLLTNGDLMVEAGIFEVVVEDGGITNCRDGLYYGSYSDIQDSSSICARYLNDQKYCP